MYAHPENSHPQQLPRSTPLRTMAGHYNFAGYYPQGPPQGYPPYLQNYGHPAAAGPPSHLEQAANGREHHHTSINNPQAHHVPPTYASANSGPLYSPQDADENAPSDQHSLHQAAPAREQLDTNADRQNAAGEQKHYKLIVCQQPDRARMCGFGEKDRRPIDPPPVVQLIVTDEQGNVDLRATLQNPLYVLHATLWSADRKEERNVIRNPPKLTRVLMGSLVASPMVLRNLENEQGLYFVFTDLSVRTEGSYCLKFLLAKLGDNDRVEEKSGTILSSIWSEPFTVYSAKKFPGMSDSTELSKCFAKQGLKIPIRNQQARLQRTRDEPENDESD